MGNNRSNTADISDRALELIMREVLHGMEECMFETAYSSTTNVNFEVIDIRPSQDGARDNKRRFTGNRSNSNAEIISFPVKNRAYG